MRSLKTDFASNPHDALSELCSVGVVSEFVVHGIQSVHHQPKREFLLPVQAELEKMLDWHMRGRTLLQVIRKQVLHKLAFQDMLDAILRVYPITKQTNAARSALVSASCVPVPSSIM